MQFVLLFRRDLWFKRKSVEDDSLYLLFHNFWPGKEKLLTHTPPPFTSLIVQGSDQIRRRWLRKSWGVGKPRLRCSETISTVSTGAPKPLQPTDTNSVFVVSLFAISGERVRERRRRREGEIAFGLESVGMRALPSLPHFSIPSLCLV